MAYAFLLTEVGVFWQNRIELDKRS